VRVAIGASGVVIVVHREEGLLWRRVVEGGGGVGCDC
jgi:hypothetical protein